jgi:hypothetical protein
MFFFEKKNQKTFARWSVNDADARHDLRCLGVRRNAGLRGPAAACGDHHNACAAHASVLENPYNA